MHRIAPAGISTHTWQRRFRIFAAALAFVLTLAGLAVVVLYACLLRRAMRGVH
ncbi:hypothetical protein [Verminephrobacter eiseniae]|uniref:hypothetical protein n=1 Tax=Verminephrobacter eiseniae TaxID=364317 RepID=UPI002238025A|nr:hypothetical protein [Verminephrobacter eiseniae]